MNRYLAAGIFIVLLTAVTLFVMPQTSKILLLKESYSIMGMGNKEGIILRLIVLVAGMISTFFLFSIMNNKETFLIKIGRNLLSVYVLHFYFVMGFTVYFKVFRSELCIPQLSSHYNLCNLNDGCGKIYFI